jgi:SAM-dependent methyltransferase
MGVLKLLPGTGDDDASLHYRLPRATAEVLANPDSKEYDIAMIQCVPSLVNRAKTMLPEAFKTGIGRPYDEPDVAEGIDRSHAAAVRDFFIPKVLPKALDGKVLEMFQNGCQVADLGCGAGILLVSLARAFPKSTFHGFEISKVALEKAAFNVASARLTNIYLHDANEKEESLGDENRRGSFDVALIYDVLHDSTHPADLVRQVKDSLKKEGVFLLADIPAAPSIRENLSTLAAPGTYFGFSACLCMSCALSTEDGAGLGTLGFSVPVAKKMLKEAGFGHYDVLSEDKSVRWFLAR